MPLMKGREAAVAANTDTGNVLQGEDQEFLDQDALVSVYAVSDVADTVASMVIGTERQLNDANVSVESAADRLIPEEDVLLDQEFAPAGARLNLSFRTVTGPADINWAVRIEPIPAGLM